MENETPVASVHTQPRPMARKPVSSAARNMANSPRITSSVSSVMANGGRAAGAAISSATERRPSASCARMRSCLLAEQSAGPHDEHQQHEQIHGGKREVGEVVVAEHLHERDQDGADQRAEEADRK